jgi:beta-mannosidase
MAGHFFSPILISGLEDNDNGTVEIHVTSDLMKTISVQAEWTLTTVAGDIVAEGSKKVRAFARKSRPVHTLKLKKHFHEYSIRDLMLWLDLTTDGQKLSTNFVSFARPKHLELLSPGIAVKIKTGQQGAFIVSLRAGKPALWTWIELENADAEFSDNYVHLRPDKEVEIRVKPKKKIDTATFKKRLKVRSLFDTY